MTFTTNQMSHQRWTVRAVTLDNLHYAMEACAQDATTAHNGPADGLSLAEATRLYAAVTRVLRACKLAHECIEHVRANDLT